MTELDRHDRVASLLKHEAATFIQNEANTDPLITVTRVSLSSDYRRATIFITTLPEGKEKDALVFLKRMGGELRGYVKKHSSMKVIPYLDFELDVGERHRQHIDEIARDIEEKKG